MKTTSVSLLAIVPILFGCTTTPSLSPKPHQSKYAFQCLQVSMPDDLFQILTVGNNDNTPRPRLTQSQIEAIIKNPGATIVKFPVVYASNGESVTNDQTKTAEMAVDANIVNGKVVYKKEPRKLGESVSITVQKVENDFVSYHIDAMSRKSAGFHNYTSKEGPNVRMPYFTSSGVNTKITQKTNSWFELAGSVDQKNNGPKIDKLIFIRIIPPTTKL